MPILSDHAFKPKYSAEDGDIVRAFYVPALSCAARYDRTTGFFSAGALLLAAQGVEGLVRNRGQMRLIVGCTLEKEEVDAIERGLAVRDAVDQRLRAVPLVPEDDEVAHALELLAWMVARGHLDVKAAVPCDQRRRVIIGPGMFHEKVGIIEDKTGDRLSFSGGINETPTGWTRNWDSFHVFTSWDGGTKHIDEDEDDFARLWSNTASRAIVIDVPEALQEGLLAFLPQEDVLPRRLVEDDAAPFVHNGPQPASEPEPPAPLDLRRAVWSFIHRAPTMPNGGAQLGEATCAITPWPHQIRAFQRMHDHWPPKLLIADEVGLGKTIEAGLLLRQAWLSGRVNRVLVLAPPVVLRQWQIELREKFNLSWPIYDGQKLSWYPSPAAEGRAERKVARDDWHREPILLTSSFLMRRRDRAREALEDAEPWDLVVVDEAHHARRRAGGTGSDDRPNLMLRLLRQLKERTQGLILLTATPMQVSPIEIWDLLDLLGLPEQWHVGAFLEFFREAAAASPSHEAMVRMARLFQVSEASWGRVEIDDAIRFLPGQSKIAARRVLGALRDRASIPLRQLQAADRRAAIKLMQANSPVGRLVSRYTRSVLRRYRDAGKLTTPIADRQVEDIFVVMTDEERRVYEEVERYISSVYNRSSANRRTAVGFVMTIYRRRLASSFHALAETLANRLAAIRQSPRLLHPADEDVPEGEIDAEGDELAADEALELERQALVDEERDEIEQLLIRIKRLPRDTKSARLLEVVHDLRRQGYQQVLVFTQFTDTLDFLRKVLVDENIDVMCFSGRGGEVRRDDRWQIVSRDEIKRRFREGGADVLLCTDAAAEGLNFQYCGGLVNYDMPWNPMRVEQRIGRIDRLGQAYEAIRVANLHYEDTVETDVYRALRARIRLFEQFVGRLQPILARLPQAIASVALAGDAAADRDRLIAQLNREAERADQADFDLDAATEPDLDVPPRPAAPYGLDDLQDILRRPELLPPGTEVEPADAHSFALLEPGLHDRVRVTTDAAYFDQNPESCELWSPGCPLFPEPDPTAPAHVGHDADIKHLRDILDTSARS